MNWIRIAAADIPEREGRVVKLGGQSLAIFNLGGRFVAMENRCPHGGGPLADGVVHGTTVTCPLHNWRVCLESGAVTKPCESGAQPVRTYPVEMQGGVLTLGVEEAAAAA